MQALQTYIPVWREVFKKASTAKKKMMLSTIIECVRVYRDSVELTLKLNISSFLATSSVSSLKGNDYDLKAGKQVHGIHYGNQFSGIFQPNSSSHTASISSR